MEERILKVISESTIFPYHYVKHVFDNVGKSYDLTLRLLEMSAAEFMSADYYIGLYKKGELTHEHEALFV